MKSGVKGIFVGVLLYIIVSITLKLIFGKSTIDFIFEILNIWYKPWLSFIFLH